MDDLLDSKFRELFIPSELADVSQRILTFRGYEDSPLVTIEETVVPLVLIVPNIQDMVSIVKECCIMSEDGLSIDESASIALYTLDSEPINKSFHFILNTTLKASDPTLLKPWFLYLKLIMTALTKIPLAPSHHQVFRGVRSDLSALYPERHIVVWWSFSSCTSSRDVLNNDARFLGNEGVRTLFIIECHSGKNIGKHSLYPDEQEVLLLPARQFEVINNFKEDNNLHIIHLQEIQSNCSWINPNEVTSFAIPNTETSKFLTKTQINLSASTKRTSQYARQNRSIKTYLLAKSQDLNNSSPDISKLNSSINRLDLSALAQQPKTQPINQLVNHLTALPNTIVATKCNDSWLQSYINALYSNRTLDKLDIRDNQIIIQNLPYLTNALKQNKTLTTLYLVNNHIGSSGAQHLADALRENKVLTTLLIRYNQLGDQGIEYIASALEQNKTLTALYLGNNKIGSQGAKFLANVLLHNHTITTLNLSSNMIESEGVKYLAIALEKNNTLTVLNLECNQINDSGAQHLSNVLLQNRTITTLSLNVNHIRSLGAEYFINALFENQTLKHLQLSKNKIDDSTQELIETIIKSRS